MGNPIVIIILIKYATKKSYYLQSHSVNKANIKNRVLSIGF